MAKLKGIGILIAGWAFLVLGFLGLFLPILQGILFIMVGLALLSSRSQTVQRLVRSLEKRFPEHHRKVEVWQERIRRWFRFGKRGMDQEPPTSG